MMKSKIQIIGIDEEKLLEIFGNDVEISLFGSSISLDSYDINIIYLGDIYNFPNFTSYLSLLQKTINKSKNDKKTVLIYPKNYQYVDSDGYKKNLNVNTRNYETELEILGIPYVALHYEYTETKINNKKINSDYCFSPTDKFNLSGLTIASNNNKITTTETNNFIHTTLNISSFEELLDFLREINFIEDNSEVPEWVENINFYNDKEQKILIKNNNAKIDDLNIGIKKANEILDENLKYKSVVHVNGDDLVEVVFEMLEDLLDYDLSEFIDEKREDFLIKKDNITFVGEVKGKNENVRNEHIHQAEGHTLNYLQDLQDNEMEENAKTILIMNREITKPVHDRNPVNNNQIKLAKDRNCLIIDSYDFLKLYEKFLNEEIDSNEIINRFTNEIGLFEL